MVQIKKSELKQALLAAARQEFIQKGFRGANLRAIAKNAGCSLSNLYNYFDNKDDLFKAVLRPRLNEIKKPWKSQKQFASPRVNISPVWKKNRNTEKK